MRKYLVIIGSAAIFSLLTALLGVAMMDLRSGSEARRAAGDEAWSLGPVAVRGEEDYRRAADGFRERYRWLVPREPEPEESTEESGQEAVANALPPPPSWHFVGVLLEGPDSFALVAESGRVKRYRVGEAFGDGTRVLALTEQSMRVSEDGEERSLFLYQKK